MSISYRNRESAIRELFEYEESYHIPSNQRLTFDPYAEISEISEASPRKKPYVDIRDVIGRVRRIRKNEEGMGR